MFSDICNIIYKYIIYNTNVLYITYTHIYIIRIYIILYYKEFTRLINLNSLQIVSLFLLFPKHCSFSGKEDEFQRY